MDLRVISRYPFLPEAKEFLKDIALEDILNSPIYESARILGFQRVRGALTGEHVNLPPPTSEENLITRFLSFVFEKLLLMAVGDPVVIRRVANAERDRLEDTLLQSPEDIDMVAQALELRFRRVDVRGMEYRVHVIDYIKQAKKFSGEEFRLVYRDLNNGWLTLHREQFVKIIREAFVDYFVADVGQEKHRKLLENVLNEYVQQINALKDDYLSRYSSVDFGEVNAEAFPPCIKSIITKIKEGINVSHEARFSMVAFLHKIGMSNEEILKIFASVPDFRKDITEYQIKHITGEISGKEYSVPKCATMRSFGLCIRDAARDTLCYKKWMTHPLLYYKIKNERAKKEPSTQQQTAESQ